MTEKTAIDRLAELGCQLNPCPATLPHKCWACDADYVALPASTDAANCNIVHAPDAPWAYID